MKDVTEVLRKEVELCEDEDIMFRPEREDGSTSVTSPYMRTKYIQNFYDKVKKEVLGSVESDVLWMENGEGNVKSFVGFVQLFLD